MSLVNERQLNNTPTYKHSAPPEPGRVSLLIANTIEVIHSSVLKLPGFFAPSVLTA
jgi:hypothetical protein